MRAGTTRPQAPSRSPRAQLAGLVAMSFAVGVQLGCDPGSEGAPGPVAPPTPASDKASPSTDEALDITPTDEPEAPPPRVRAPADFSTVPAVYVANVTLEGAESAEVALNDVAVLSASVPSDPRDFRRVDMWIAPGTNTLTVETHGATDATVVELTVDRMPPGQPSDQLKPIFTRTLRGNALASPVALEFEVESPPTRRLWQEADVLANRADVLAAARKAAREVHSLFVAHDQDAIVKRFDPKVEDLAMMSGKDSTQGEKDLRSFLQYFEGMKMVGLPTTLKTELVANGRAVRVSKAEDRPLLEAEGGSPAIDVYLCRIDGEWWVVR